MTQKERKIRIKKASDKFVRWVGSTNSLIAHTIFFAIMIALAFSDIGFDKVMLVLTTVVSLEAIYLSIFIQMTVNKHGEELEEVSDDIDEIQEDVEGIEKDIDEIQEDVDEIQEDDENEELEQKKDDELMQRIEDSLGKLIEEVVELKKQSKTKQAKNKNKTKKNAK